MELTKSKKILRVGVDFDGVVAYNPFRILRAPVTVAKRILGNKKTKFFIPKTYWQKILWSLFHESSFFPGKGLDKLQKLSRNKKVELYLVTARYSFLKENLYKWIDRNNLGPIFKRIYLNEGNEQPHEFKSNIAKSLKLDYFIEDNLDVVNFMEMNTKTKILWVSNFVDRLIYAKKSYRNIGLAVEAIEKSLGV